MTVRTPALPLPARHRLDLPLRRAAWLAPPLAYASFAVVWLGRGVVLHPESHVLGDRFPDKTIVMWSFLWWPHQLVHGHDPFAATAVWAPHGIDLAWVTAMPGASLLLAPLSETLGPVFAYNVASLAAPALAAWATYFLARRLTSDARASLVAGFLFGFSPYLTAQAASHLNLTLVFAVPLLGWLAVRFVDGDLDRRRYVAFAALALVLQFSFSTEIAATLTLVGAIVLSLALLLLRELRPRLRQLAACTALAYGLAGVVVLPYLLHAFAGGTTAPARGVVPASADLANLAVPTRTTWLRPPGSDAVAAHFASNGAEQGAYLGFPLLAILALAALGLRRRGQRGVLLLLLAMLATTLLAVGPVARVDGHEISRSVWTWLERLPTLHSALPIRLDMYTALFAALAAALWLARPGRRRWRYALAALAVVAVLPSPAGARWTSAVPQPSFFDTPAYRPYLGHGEAALVLPYGPTGWSMLWQAETHFRFALLGGWVGRSVLPAECKWYWDYRALIGVRPPDGGAGFRRFLIAHRVRAVVEAPGTQAWAKRLIAAALPDVRPARVADATVLLLPPGLPPRLPRNAPYLPPANSPQRPPSGLPCTVPPYVSPQ